MLALALPAQTGEAVSAAIGSLTLLSLLYALATLAICLIAVKLVLTILRRILDRSKLDARVAGYIASAAKVLLLLLTVLMVADQLGIPITSLIALLSVLSLAVTLAVQTVLSNVAGGLVILSAKPFSVGDYIAAGGSEGTVREIRLSHTCMDSPAGQRIVLPNGALSGEKIVNYTHLGRRRVEINVSASYDAPVQTVRSAMLEAVRRTEGVLPDPAPAAVVSSYGDSSIQYRLLCWSSAADYWAVYYLLLEEIRACFNEAGVEMTYNHLNIHILEK